MQLTRILNNTKSRLKKLVLVLSISGLLLLTITNQPLNFFKLSPQSLSKKSTTENPVCEKHFGDFPVNIALQSFAGSHVCLEHEPAKIEWTWANFRSKRLFGVPGNQWYQYKNRLRGRISNFLLFSLTFLAQKSPEKRAQKVRENKGKFEMRPRSRFLYWDHWFPGTPNRRLERKLAHVHSNFAGSCSKHTCWVRLLIRILITMFVIILITLLFTSFSINFSKIKHHTS